MAYPEYMDDRASGFFSYNFVGSSQGDDGSSYRTSWDSRCGVAPTSMLAGRGRPCCTYCGNRGLPLQPNIEHGDYNITGYTCVCKGAMDELDWLKATAEMKERHKREVSEMEKSKPAPNLQVKKDIIARLTAKLHDSEDEYEFARALEELQEFKGDKKERHEISW